MVMVGSKCQKKLTLLIVVLILFTVIDVYWDVIDIRKVLANIGTESFVSQRHQKQDPKSKTFRNSVNQLYTPSSPYNSNSLKSKPANHKHDKVKIPSVPLLSHSVSNDHQDKNNIDQQYYIYNEKKHSSTINQSEILKNMHKPIERQGNEIPEQKNYNLLKPQTRPESISTNKAWLLKNPNILVYPVVTQDILPEYLNTTSTDMTLQYEKYHAETALIMEQRKSLIREKCELKKRYLVRSQNFLYYFPNLQTTWCPTFKAGSTNWKQFFCRIYKPDIYQKHKNNQTEPYCPMESLIGFRLNNAENKEQWMQGVKRSVKFLTVRHPYERLVSVYNNKFRRCPSNMFVDRDMLYILRLYRDVKLPVDLKNQYLEAARLECHKPEKDRILDKDNPYMKPIGVTFREFILYIVMNYNNKKFPDFHWISHAKGCDLCITYYDVIEKFETLERDHYYYLKLIGEERKYREIAGIHSNPSGNSKLMLEDYFSTLDEKLLWSLAAIYKDDFDLFGYKPHYRVKKNPYH